MFNKILIANRGEIALRIIRACRDLGVKTLAVYSEADKNSPHVRLADEAICIGKAASNESYLKIERIIGAAEIGDVDAIHPGYGFLAENAHFAEVCESCNIKFIGPKPSAIRSMGDKAVARETARKAGVPITPGSDGLVDTEQEALKVAKKIGYPVMIKAVAGGGGRGMRRAHNDVSLIQGFHAAKMEAEKAFGNGGLYVEKLIEQPHHIEFQVLADRFGKVIHLGERDCSIQRRNQKLIEEAPSAIVNADLRKKMGKASVKLAEAVQYENAGTIEYLVDHAGNFYFMEMNTRIQVEHPVTEEVYGIDLVRKQIEIAAGLPLGKEYDDVKPLRHAIEIRINAEDPYDNFRPSPGKIESMFAPGGIGVRLDTHAYAGYVIPPYYDSMIGKLIVTGPDRKTAIDRALRALGEFSIRGVKTTIPLASEILRHGDFQKGDYSTHFIESHFSAGVGGAAKKE
ncbi:acetyl-CoA carboxylase, biotin carboxylase subunit [Verrucomicrobium sp. GAS474]|uniref:acetyl-CoA carboxylase biotin carboxylase subunit n=1 Tax=Verrucomicrobium sp. GAS474 TaxID=1882831 RepID=UPI000879DE00|nr:acetyl-CoA carboxylase biotin carboxylase subunit [Verrucomicrobium sp. GAS474]SDU17513.1 acetyl-CoA carboxylase, biotin carboxylase subunit [Verrucomicrobium sp. GAS474]